MEQNQISQTMLDQMVGTDQGQMRKAIIPYLPSNCQQILSVYEKASELRNTIALFANRSDRMEMSAASVQTRDPLEMISDIRKFCYGSSRKQLDSVANMLAMVEMMQIMNDFSQKGGDKNE